MLSSMPSQFIADQWPKVIDPGKKWLNIHVAVVNGEVQSKSFLICTIHIKPSYSVFETKVMHF